MQLAAGKPVEHIEACHMLALDTGDIVPLDIQAALAEAPCKIVESWADTPDTMESYHADTWEPPAANPIPARGSRLIVCHRPADQTSLELSPLADTPEFPVVLVQALSRRHAPVELAVLLCHASGFRALLVVRAAQVQFVAADLVGLHPG